MNEENKAVELTNENLKQVSGGVNNEAEVKDGLVPESCAGDCDGKFPCRNTKCPYGYK